MDCLEFRRVALADPRRFPAAAAAHTQSCAACKGFLERSLEDEARLADALRVVVPQRFLGTRPRSGRAACLCGYRRDRRRFAAEHSAHREFACTMSPPEACRTLDLPTARRFIVDDFPDRKDAASHERRK